MTRSATLIGHILTKEGLRPDPKETEATINMTSPKNKKELQRFLGMLTYLSKFILNLSHISAPLKTLLEKDVEWHWQDDPAKTFVALRN